MTITEILAEFIDSSLDVMAQFADWVVSDSVVFVMVGLLISFWVCGIFVKLRG